MTDRPTSGATTEQAVSHGGDLRLSRALGRARWTILWERLWPALATVATAVGLFLAVSWLGACHGCRRSAAPSGSACSSAPRPSRPPNAPHAEQQRRSAPARPQYRIAASAATAIADDLATDTGDRCRSRCGAHIERALRAATTLKAGLPVPRLARRDPYALRGLVLVLLVATFFAAGGDRLRRIAAAFDWQGVVAPANFRIDAWVNPPTYTGKPPVILAGLRPGEAIPTAASTLSVPAGSMLVIRATGQVRLDVVTTGGLVEPKTGAHATGQNGTEERRFVINEAGTVKLRSIVASDVVWQFTAIPDRPPTIALAKDPEGQARGALQLSYKVEDDYGVVGAQANFKLKDGAGTNGQPPRPLYEAPDVPLVLPQARTKSGTGQTTKDLTEHPWAGADASMTLTARDEAGNEGSSAPFELRLPERPFTKPGARALIEQRRMLALDADAQARVLNAPNVLTIAPQQLDVETNV